MHRFTNFSQGSSFVSAVVHCSSLRKLFSKPPSRPTNPPLRPSNLIGHTGRNVTLYDGLELFSFPPRVGEVEKTFRERAVLLLPQPPNVFFLLSSPVCVSLDLHMKVIDLVFYDLFIDTKTALRSGEKEGERERAFHSSQHPFFSPALPPLQPPPLLLRKKNFLLLSCGWPSPFLVLD